MAETKIEIGPTGQTVSANVRRLREEQNLTVAKLSRRLAERGRVIAPLGLRRLEAGQRRVDADDLTALAVVLGTSPASLLMPDLDSPEATHAVTGGRRAVPVVEGDPSPGSAQARDLLHEDEELPSTELRAAAIWEWLTAERPLDQGVRWVFREDGSESVAVDWSQLEQFLARSRPRWRRWGGSHPAEVSARLLDGYVSLALNPAAAEDGKADPEQYRAMLAAQMRVALADLVRLADLLEAGGDPQDWPLGIGERARGRR